MSEIDFIDDAKWNRYWAFKNENPFYYPTHTNLYLEIYCFQYKLRNRILFSKKNTKIRTSVVSTFRNFGNVLWRMDQKFDGSGGMNYLFLSKAIIQIPSKSPQSWMITFLFCLNVSSLISRPRANYPSFDESW